MSSRLKRGEAERPGIGLQGRVGLNPRLGRLRTYHNTARIETYLNVFDVHNSLSPSSR